MKPKTPQEKKIRNSLIFLTYKRITPVWNGLFILFDFTWQISIISTIGTITNPGIKNPIISFWYTVVSTI